MLLQKCRSDSKCHDTQNQNGKADHFANILVFQKVLYSCQQALHLSTFVFCDFIHRFCRTTTRTMRTTQNSKLAMTNSLSGFSGFPLTFFEGMIFLFPGERIKRRHLPGNKKILSRKKSISAPTIIGFHFSFFLA